MTEIISRILSENASKKITHSPSIDNFLSKKSDILRFAVGRNDSTLNLNNEIKIDAIIDDFFLEKSWNGIPIIKSSDIAPNSIIVNCSTSISPVSSHKKFSKINGSYLIGYFELLNAYPEKYKSPDFVTESLKDLKENQANWQKLYDNLRDEISKKTLSDILRYRISADYNNMIDYSVRITDQYFEDFMDYHEEVFVDAGGFIGDTSEEFVKRYPDCKHIYFFEPSSRNMIEAKKRLNNLNEIRKIDFIEYGLSDSSGELFFNSDLGSSSSISKHGKNKINVTTLDDYIDEKVTFIKMDLEGWEMKALLGAKQHIEKDHPKLAIAVYHNPSDFWKVYDYVMSIRSDYDIYLRHYTEGWSETIMYFKPKD